MRKRTLARECALHILYQHEMNHEPVGEVVASFWEQETGVPDEVRRFAEKLVYGTLDNLAKLDEIIARAADNWQIERMAVVDRNILRFATYELLFLEEIPPKVTINEAVNLAKKFSQAESGKFVNGILDRISHTEKARTASPDAPSEPV